jgi:hypothetical protein
LPGPAAQASFAQSPEHEAWEVLLASQGQIRLAPSGHIIGIDMDAALKIGAARGYDITVLGTAAGWRGGAGRGAP